MFFNIDRYSFYLKEFLEYENKISKLLIFVLLNQQNNDQLMEEDKPVLITTLKRKNQV
jgi:hypothetical protein